MKKLIKWFENYWYYYKWITIIVTFFSVVIIFCVVQMSGNEEYDINILYTGPHIFEVSQKASIESAFIQVMNKDFNGDGKKTVQIVDMTAFTDKQAEKALESLSPLVVSQYHASKVEDNFSQQIFAGDSVICLLDRYWYEIVLENEGFAPLKEILGYKPDFAIDDYGVYLKDMKFGQYFTVLSSLPEDTILCMRKISSASLFTGEKKVKRNYGYNKEMFCDIFSFEFPEGYSTGE